MVLLISLDLEWYWGVHDSRSFEDYEANLRGERDAIRGILYQALITLEADDNFATYPILQLVQGLPLMSAALRDVAVSRVTPRIGEGPSRQWYHPTLLGYWKTRLQRGVK